MVTEYTAADAREAAIRELLAAVSCLRCGQVHEAETKAHSALAWIHEVS